jgi:tyrosine-protein phosphatase SIW14
MRRTLVQPFVILAVLFLAGGLTAAEKAPQKAPRPDAWAKPIAAEYVRNFFQLDEKVYRSAQPTRKGFQELQARGIRNVLNLRDYHSDEDDAQDTVLSLYRVKMEAGDITDEKVIEALRIIRKAEGPVLVHCWHGSDRTGLISAMYRILFQNWSKEEAIEELMKGGYGYHSLYRNIPEYIRKVPMESIRRGVFAP